MVVNLIKGFIDRGFYKEVFEETEKNDISNEEKVTIACFLMNVSQNSMAIKLLSDVLEEDPENLKALYHISVAYLKVGKSSESMDAITELLGKNCNLHYLSNSFIISTHRGDFGLASNRYAWERAIKDIPIYEDYVEPIPDYGRKIRVGYIGSTIHGHSIMHALLPLIRNHDKDDFEIFLYSMGERNDVYTSVAAKLSNFRNVSNITISKILSHIRKDRIDILVDLDSHHSQSIVVASARPAPIIISYIGFAGSPYSSRIDYRICDKTTDPNGSNGPESCLWTDGPFIAFESLVQPSIKDRNRDHVVFGSFNSFRKIEPVVMKAWKEILDRVPNSKFIMKCQSLKDDILSEEMMDYFGRERTTIIKQKEKREEHLACYNMIDISLDPFCFSGTITTCESLTMGVPVITLKGDRHQNRVSASLMEHSFPEYVTNDINEYISKAVDLAKNLPDKYYVADRFAKSPTTDGKRIANEVEALYKKTLTKYLDENKHAGQPERIILTEKI